MLTFIFCIYCANLSFIHMIYLSFSDREFIAISKACVESGKAYLNRIYISVKHFPLHIEESSSHLVRQSHCSCNTWAVLCTAELTEITAESPEWVQTDVGNGHTLLWGDRPVAVSPSAGDSAEPVSFRRFSVSSNRILYSRVAWKVMMLFLWRMTRNPGLANSVT